MKGDCSGPRSAEAVLQHPDVEVAVLETARGGILRSGLGFDQCQVAVVLNVSDDHLGLDGIDSPEKLAGVKRCRSRASPRRLRGAQRGGSLVAANGRVRRGAR